MKTAEMDRVSLNWAVAKALGFIDDQTVIDRDGELYTYDERSNHMDEPWNPAGDWAQGGWIIEQECIAVSLDGGTGDWTAWYPMRQGMIDGFGPTPLIAAMRCFVASKLGGDIDIPESFSEAA